GSGLPGPTVAAHRSRAHARLSQNPVQRSRHEPSIESRRAGIPSRQAGPSTRAPAASDGNDATLVLKMMRASSIAHRQFPTRERSDIDSWCGRRRTQWSARPPGGGRLVQNFPGAPFSLDRYPSTESSIELAYHRGSRRLACCPARALKQNLTLRHELPMNRLTASSLFAVFLFGCSGQINPIDSGPVGGAGGAPPGTSGAGGAPPTGSGGMGLGTGGIAKGGAPGVGGTASGGGPAGGAPAGGASGGAPPVAGGSSGGGAPAGGGTGGSGKGGATPGEGGMGPLGGMGGTGGAGMGGEAMGGGGTGGTETEPIPKHTIP